MYEARERTTSRSRIALARKALTISPHCADAYVLLAEEAALKKLLASYEDEGSASWLYTQALLAFRGGGEGDERAARLAREAWTATEHVPAILAGTRPPAPPEEGYITMGGPDEATEYVRECGPAWHHTPGAVAWLTKAVADLPPKRRARPAAH